MDIERSFVMLKPGVFPRRIVGEVLARLERKGLKIVGMRMARLDEVMASRLYAEHAGQYYYERLMRYSISGPVLLLAVEGRNAIAIIRRLAGSTMPDEAQAGTIRGDYGLRGPLNVIHSSDGQESAARELALFFGEGDICPWEDGNDAWY